MFNPCSSPDFFFQTSFPQLLKKVISELPFASVSKTAFVQNHSNENDFDLHENGREGGRHFHMNGFAHRVLSETEAKSNSEMANWRARREDHVIAYKKAS